MYIENNIQYIFTRPLYNFYHYLMLVFCVHFVSLAFVLCAAARSHTCFFNTDATAKCAFHLFTFF